ncbi:MAG: phosphate starvation-inducible protein PhoH [Bacillota bacterium]|jgi:phosphate starvation-inducible PhoH-like protein|nr:phosphate starvation-inducible protein PhoH [Bacillota bacterium]MDK2882768.1 phosphate starvation-inducible protein PhoH [Bacillota bacterium]MDK2924346.1 phosphate starvation-inducible protein PhoH [Bacillota bacterium]
MLQERKERRIEVASNDEALRLFGHFDENLRYLESELPVKLVPRGTEVIIIGEAGSVEQAVQVLEQLRALARDGNAIAREDVRLAIGLAKKEGGSLDPTQEETILVTHRGKAVKPKTLGQKRYIEAIRRHDVVFGIGPAGTGKTYLAMAMAVRALKNREINRIVLTRPAVEAGEKLGFLPGDLQEKVDPYLRPLYDALYDFLGVETYQKYAERGLIEIAPLAYMRGRTLDDSFILLDEAQNTTPEQMKMFLTRLGFGSKAVITGDITQVDLPRGRFSGLEEVRFVLRDVEGIAFIYFNHHDVVRHELVQRIITAYEEYERAQEGRAAGEEG